VSATVVKNQIAIVYKSKTDLHASPNPGIDYRSVYIGIVSKNNEFVNAIKPTKSYPRTSSRIYWEERSIRRTLEAEYHGLSYLRQIYNVYSEASREITRQVQDIYARYYKDKGFDVEALRELVPQGDIMRLRKQIRELGLNVELPDNYNARINRLELLNFQIQVEMNRASRKIDKLMGKSLAETYKNSYYRTAYDTSKGIGQVANFSKLNTKSVRKVLSEKNYGKNFSERIWGRSQKLGNELKEIVGKAIATGQSHAKTSRLIRERFNVSKSSADRLIRTETNYYENQAELDSYKEMGIEKYQFIATIDTRTSEICQHLDKKVFRVKDATPGVNMPPMHPNCRSTITAYLGEKYEADTRAARNRKTNVSEYIENMGYKEWLGQFPDLNTDISEDWAE
jgi:phage head morphogenesis protein, SPP1 gp7 family